MSVSLSSIKKNGSSKSGSCHWLNQRLSAIMLLITMPWFLVALTNIMKNPAYINALLASPFNISVLLIFSFSALFHGNLGAQMVITDYISNKAVANFLIISCKLLCFVTFFVLSISAVSAHLQLQLPNYGYGS